MKNNAENPLAVKVHSLLQKKEEEKKKNTTQVSQTKIKLYASFFPSAFFDTPHHTPVIMADWSQK